ncbi:MAG: hypothetical protein ACLQVN_09295 [Bryobacteraceae bacterium]
MLQTVRLALADTAYAAALRDALNHTCAWHIDSAESLEPGQPCVLVLDDRALARLPLSLSHPECIVLITHKNSERMAQAWDAGIVSVVGWDDPIDTVLLAIMAAALRCPTLHSHSVARAISPNPESNPASITPVSHRSSHKRCKVQ